MLLNENKIINRFFQISIFKCTNFMWAFTIQYSCYYLANNCFFILCIPSDFNFGAYLMLIYSWGNITHTHQPHLFDWSFLKYSMPPRRKRINIVFSFCIFLWQIWETIKKKQNLYYKEWCPKTAEERMLKERRTHDFPPRHIFSWFKGNERARVVYYICVAVPVDEKRSGKI